MVADERDASFPAGVLEDPPEDTDSPLFPADVHCFELGVQFVRHWGKCLPLFRCWVGAGSDSEEEKPSATEPPASPGHPMGDLPDDYQEGFHTLPKLLNPSKADSGGQESVLPDGGASEPAASASSPENAADGSPPPYSPDGGSETTVVDTEDGVVLQKCDSVTVPPEEEGQEEREEQR